MQHFKKECDEFMEQYGYTLHLKSGDGKTLIYTKVDLSSNDTTLYPAIEFTIDNSENKSMRLYDNVPYKLFLQLSTSGHIQFKHPKLQLYINTFVHYARIAQKFPPF